MTEKTIDKARGILKSRQLAYKRTFTGEAAKSVLVDLAEFCRAHQSTFHADPRVAANLDGRREVWLRIQEHLNLSDEDMWQLLIERKNR